jgi:hypothetical protein
MEVLRVPMQWVEGFAPQRLAAAMGCSTSEAVGALVLFLASTRRSGLEEGSYAKVASHVIGTGDAHAMMDGLAKIGVLAEAESDRLRVVPNEGLKAQTAMAVERAKRARAMVGKKKVAKKKAKADAAPEPAQGQLVVAKPVKAVKETDQGLELRRHAWEAYRTAYRHTTGQDPLDNMKARSLIMQFCKHVGADAPSVLDFYCRHPNRKYITAVYPLSMAVYDASGLHTQWKNGSYVTYEGAKSAGFDAEFLHRIDQLDQQYAQLPPEG